MSGGSEAKKHPASETKLRKQREKGSIANSQESSGFMACALAVGVLIGTCGMIWQNMQAMIITSLDVINMPFDEARRSGFATLGQLMLGSLLPVLGVSLAVAFLTAIICNKGPLFSIKPVTPQLSRVSPMAGFKRIYGQRGLIETPISALRILLWLCFAGIAGFLPVLQLVMQWPCDVQCWSNQLMAIFAVLTTGAVIMMLMTAGLDMLVQQRLFLQEQKMTDTELKNERKDQFGSAEVRQERRRQMREAAHPRRKPNADHATMCFYTGDTAVAIEFRPPVVSIPYVMIRTQTFSESLRLRRLVAGNGWPELEHDGLTKAGLRTKAGDPLDEDQFSDFVDAVTILFGR